MTRHEQIKQAVMLWEDITANSHRFGGTEFKVGKVEIGHVHGNTMVDIPFTVKIRERLVADGEAEPHHLLAESGWISFYLRHDGDITQAVKLLRISYLQKRLRRAEPERAAKYADEIASLPVSLGLKQIMLVSAYAE